MPVFQAVLVLQALMIIRSAVEITASTADISSEIPCRVLVSLSLCLAILPAYLCNFCLIYLQLSLLHRHLVTRRWPRVVLVLMCVIPAVVPESFILFIPTKQAGLQSYCNYDSVPSTRLYGFKWLVCYTWIILAGIIGITSMVTSVVHVHRSSAEVGDYTTESSSKPSNGTKRQTRLTNRILISVVWFPLVPIVSLYFNVIHNTLRFVHQRDFPSVDRADTVLQFLQALFVSLAFFVSPPVRRALEELTHREENPERSGYLQMPLDQLSQKSTQIHSTLSSVRI
ncbi:hypothetical protein FBU59_001204 [Linderina macrospora]|uniref:Uncharacterized protein n=1 Tax=Linderina macrospora TaxID=4868 RepID=A0ACC1JEH4_9FUNG|nr:hypothetical protein FBU59_001204 [Linderina macrospora]